MIQKTAVYLPLTFLCGTLLLAQNWQPTDGNWTDKNNTERYAAYLLETTYYQQGIAARESKSNRMAPSGFLLWNPERYFI
jgi:hypothetical protein